MNISDFLVKLVKETNGWVIVVVFALYVGYHCYKKHKEGEALTKSLSILETTIVNLLGSIEQNIGNLVSRIDLFLSRT